MSANVEPEEVEAVLDGVVDSVHGAAEVAARDFRRPQRFSTTRLAALELELQKPIKALPAALEENCGIKLGLSIASVAEVSAEGLFAGVGDDSTILTFLVAGQPGWMRWEATEAVAVAETMLGAGASSALPRTLTRLEQRLVGEPLVTIVAALAQALGLEVSDFAFAANAESAGSWRDAAENPDSHRLGIELDVSRDDGEGSSTAHVYLPTGSQAARGLAEQAQELPAHLAPVSVEISVQLARTEITLSQLLQLEEGDVIPTDVRIDETAQLMLEERPFARAHLGTHRGRFAVRIATAENAGESLS